MKMRSAMPFLAMVVSQFAQVALMVVSKKAMASGIANFAFIFYSNAIASLILLPSSFLIHRSNRPPLTFSLVSGFVLLGILGYLGMQGFSMPQQLLPPQCSTSSQVLPSMERVDFRSSSALAKTIGTVVSVAGAFIVALYKGPTIISNLSLLNLTLNDLLIQPSNWILGGIFLAIDCVFASMFIIAQAMVLKKCPAELTVMFAYCFIVAILSAATSLILEKDMSTWSLQPNVRLYAVLYSGVFGSAFQVTIGGWCVKRKGPLFVAMFHPLGIVIATAMGFMFLGDSFYFGSLVGSIVIVIGFYSVMWGKAKEGKMVKINLESSPDLTSEKAPLLQNNVEFRTQQ
ncbi:hypothetical protein LguiA_032725 [Lonicera macranthoides]